MITINKRKHQISFCIDDSCNNDARQIIELLAIKYFASRRYKFNDGSIAAVTYDFEDEVFMDDLFFSTLIGNLIHTGLNISNYNEDIIYLQNVS